MSKKAREHRWFERARERLIKAGMDTVKLEKIWLEMFVRHGKPNWREHLKVTITVVGDTVYDMSASTGYHPLGTRWPYIPPKRTPLIKKGSKP